MNVIGVQKHVGVSVMAAASLRVAARRCALPFVAPACRSATSSKLRNKYNLHCFPLTYPQYDP